ncbi:hypothetical protein F8M41_005151 [Gigaspora margarita]|uniref:Uncharacterized protein n=1 Tax=Gigaspora margarita TaxID=4874 RepID=A0A8H3XA31_GIGMA|nr:hypothetical protein F8M41_005151 [Gigaspora margarita]
MAQYNGFTKLDNKESTNVLTQQVRTQHLTKAIIHKCIRLCFPSRNFSHKDISALKTAANAAYRSYRNALRNSLEKVARCFIEDFKIESLSQVIDEEATFTTEFKEAWRTFMSKCLLKMIEEILNDEKKLVKITDLDSLTLDYNIYNAGDVLNPNDTSFKVLLKKELDNKGRSK